MQIKNTMVLITSLLILAYLVMGKDVKPLLKRLQKVEWQSEIRGLLDRLRPWAYKVGRATARPLLQLYYVLLDEQTSTLDRVMIYAAIGYVVLPIDLLPRAVYKVLGVLDEGVAMLYVYKKIKSRLTPAIRLRVEQTLDEWFGVEYEMIVQSCK